jgi:hypothetical protein
MALRKLRSQDRQLGLEGIDRWLQQVGDARHTQAGDAIRELFANV